MQTVLFQTWKSKTDIPRHLSLWQQTWIGHHPLWQHTFWDDHDNREFIRNHYPWFLEKYDAYPREIFRADVIRYFFLYHYGGVYVDMDFECLKPLDPLLNGITENVILGRMGGDGEHPHSIPNALLIAKTAQHPFWLHVIAHLQARPASHGPELATGPVMLHSALRSFSSSDIAVLPPEYFYPVNWSTEAGQCIRQRVIEQGRLLTEQEKHDLFPKAYAVTYWAHTW
jgi:mannosyltransferase OCH1-like enzyme